jgi:para-nitrobenzyl esterase
MPDPIARTDTGTVGGVRREHGSAFYGIPYARPPFGELRFQAPRPPAPWDGVRPAIAPAPTAPQPAAGFTLIPEPVIDGGDAPDCLVVNVFTPDLGAARLPVLVWIHGGGFTSGTPSSPWYDGDRFARDGIVVVSVGYRLGCEGFLPMPGCPANRGVLDWLCALEWVQRNIASFGGDPSRVTVGGQSAGGAASLLISTLPRAEGLFRAVIPMSGSAFPTPRPDASERLLQAVADALGVAPTAAAFAEATPAALVAAQQAAITPSPSASILERLNFFPTVDGDIVPLSPMDAVRAGRGGTVPMLIGSTLEEFNATAALLALDPEQETAALRKLGLGDDGIAAYQREGGLGQAVTDRVFRVPADRVSDLRAGPTFRYEFRWQTAELGGLGAVHCLDVPFVWDVLDEPHVKTIAGPSPPQQLADAMHQAWVRFITDGDPGWTRYQVPERTAMVFDETSKVVEDVLGSVRDRWPEF